MDRFWDKTLARKLTRLLFWGLCVSAAAFFAVFYMGNALLKEYFFSSDFIYNAETPYINELRAFVQKERIAATDVMQLKKWVRQKGVQRLTVSRARTLIYDSAYSDSVILGKAETEELHYNWQYFHSVAFADGSADVYIYDNYEIRYYLLFYVSDAALCVFIWGVFFALGIHKEVRYIQQLRHSVTQIGNGEFDTVIPIKGSDELAMLADGLDRMRLALAEKEAREKQMKAEQDELVLGMAHDLRTPLTGLMAFLEIAGKQQTIDGCAHYINKAYAKTEQIHALSDRLFEFFLISSKQPVHLEDPENAEYALGECLSGLCELLGMQNYQTDISGLFWKPVQVRICVDYAGRIMDNLVSNIKKYADPRAPVKLSSEYSPSSIRISIQNKAARPGQDVCGTGIGVKNIRLMMEQMGGSCSVRAKSGNYRITLCFPIVIPAGIEKTAM